MNKLIYNHLLDMYQVPIKDINNNLLALFAVDENNVSELSVYYRDQKSWDTINSIVERESMKLCNDIYFMSTDDGHVYTFENSVEIAWDILHKILLALHN